MSRPTRGQLLRFARGVCGVDQLGELLAGELTAEKLLDCEHNLVQLVARLLLRHKTSVASGKLRQEPRSEKAKVFEQQWKLLNYAFDLPDPSTFPAIGHQLTTEDRSAIDRYIKTCRELEGFSVLVNDRTLHLSGGMGRETKVSFTMPAKEIILGFAVRFRQLHSDDPASYTVVKNIISKLWAERDRHAPQPGESKSASGNARAQNC